MKRLTLGVVVGFLAGLLVSKLFERPRDADIPTASAASAESTSTIAANQPEGAAAYSDNDATTVVSASGRPIPRNAGHSNRGDDSQVAFGEPAADYTSSRARTTAQPQSASLHRARASTAMPITLEPPQKAMIDNDPAAMKLHAEIESEEDDLAWAYYMEEQLRSYFVTQPSAAAWQVTGIDCRTTGCIVQAQSATADMGQAATLIQPMSQQPWWDFVNARTSTRNFDQGIALLIMMQKKKS